MASSPAPAEGGWTWFVQRPRQLSRASLQLRLCRCFPHPVGQTPWSTTPCSARSQSSDIGAWPCKSSKIWAQVSLTSCAQGCHHENGACSVVKSGRHATFCPVNPRSSHSTLPSLPASADGCGQQHCICSCECARSVSGPGPGSKWSPNHHDACANWKDRVKITSVSCNSLLSAFEKGRQWKQAPNNIEVPVGCIKASES